MKQVFPHDLALETAKKAVEMAWEHYSERFTNHRLTIQWRGDLEARVWFQVTGMTLGFELSIGPDSFEISAKIPLVLRVFKKRATAIIEKEISKWSEKAVASG